MEFDHLIQAINEEPDEDNWRLVLADYLEERGDPRAEIIRLQLESKQLTRCDRSRRNFEAGNRHPHVKSQETTPSLSFSF